MTRARKGIVLAGGTGSRLHPMTIAVSKQLLPVFDKPMIYYPISCLMLAGIRDVLIITTPHEHQSFKRLLGDGASWGVNIEYAVQEKPNGIAEAFLIAETFLTNSPATLILGDNIFYGHDLQADLVDCAKRTDVATIIAQRVTDPERYGVVEIDKSGNISSLVEKPVNPVSDYAVTGCYFYPNDVVDFSKDIAPSARGELEITDLNLQYLSKKRLQVKKLGRGHAWFDTGTNDSLLEASMFVSTLEKRQGLMIACPEEIAFNSGWIEASDIEAKANAYGKSMYGNYLRKLTNSIVSDG